MSVVIEMPTKIKEPPKVQVIEARKRFTGVQFSSSKKKRVAAYCRVSTDSDQQELSFETQCEYYKNHIMENEEYEFVDVYADEGISGTSLSKREGFNRMMGDAKAGKLDLIITKSITRFARNTVDSLKSLRTLKEYGTEVYFELENIYSLEGSEMLITILSSLAQESSQEKSDSVKWGFRRQFEKGKVYASNMYGYKSNRGELLIVEEEAKIVREIFSMYLQGMSDHSIAKMLTDRCIKTKRGRENWNDGSIRGILTNEKYTGNAKSGKTFNVDFLHPKRLQNTGQAPMYIVENSHEAIVPIEIFQMVQFERARRKNNKKEIDIAVNSGKYTYTNSLSNRIICANCGNLYRRAVWTKRNGEKQPVWRCSNRLDGGKHMCDKSITLKENKLFEELVQIINDVLSKKDKIIKEIAKKASEFINPKDIVKKKEEFNQQLEELNSIISHSLDEGMLLISRGVQDEKYLKEHLEEHYNKKRKLLSEINELDLKLESIKEIKKSKIVRTLEQMQYPVSNLSQEEILLFIKTIIVGNEYIEVTTTTEDVYTISKDKVQ